MGFLSKIVGSITGGDILGGITGFLGGERTNSANAASVNRQMEFQERMRDTAYQAAVKDMKAAGLNPMLAYSQGGASAPTGTSIPAVDSIGAGMSSAFSRSQIEKIRSDVDLNRQLTDTAVADAGLKSSSAREADARAAESRARAAAIIASLPSSKFKGKVSSFFDVLTPSASSAQSVADPVKSAVKGWLGRESGFSRVYRFLRGKFK